MIAVTAENWFSTKVSWEGTGTHHCTSGSETVAPFEHSADGATFNTVSSRSWAVTNGTVCSLCTDMITHLDFTDDE